MLHDTAEILISHFWSIMAVSQRPKSESSPGTSGESSASARETVLRSWFAEPLGQHLLALQRDNAKELLAETTGYRLMELLICTSSALRENAPQLHRFAIAQAAQEGVGAVAEYYSLPLPSGVVDVAMLRHVLDYCEYPHESLKEAARVVLPSGQIVIFGFNPYSLLGLLRWLLRPFSSNVIWRCRCLSVGRINDWLRLLGFQCEKVIYGGYNPPLQVRGRLAKMSWLEKSARKLHLPFGNYYVIVARKQRLRPIPRQQEWLVKAIHPVKLASKKPVVEPTKSEP